MQRVFIMIKPTLLSLSILIAAMSVAAAAAAAVSDSDAGIYGQLDLAKFPKPKLTNSKPVIIEAIENKAASKPVYIHIAPGQEQHWRTLCKTYAACAAPVYFVTENWFLNVYLPAVGAQDGREQRYRVNASRERSTERDNHDAHGTE
jgi:hypothetical protein